MANKATTTTYEVSIRERNGDRSSMSITVDHSAHCCPADIARMVATSLDLGRSFGVHPDNSQDYGWSANTTDGANITFYDITLTPWALQWAADARKALA